MERVFFSETQKFDQAWIRILLGLVTFSVCITFGIGIYRQIFLGLPFGDKPAPDVLLVILAVFFILLAAGLWWLFVSLRLIVEVSGEGISYRFPPFIRKGKLVRKTDIAEYAIRRYKPVMEYGGWGIRWGGGKTGDAFNVKGNTGLQLRLQNGKKILFGTQRPDALRAAMDKMMKPPLT